MTVVRLDRFGRLIVGDDPPEGYADFETVDGQIIRVQTHIPSKLSFPKEITEEEAMYMTREEFEARKLAIEAYYNWPLGKSND